MRNRDLEAGHEPSIPLSKTAKGDFLSRSLYFILQPANRVVSRQFDDALRPIGLTGRQLIILGAIAEQGTLRRTALAEVLGKDHTTITANLEPLIRRGLAASTVDRDDRRVRRIPLLWRAVAFSTVRVAS